MGFSAWLFGCGEADVPGEAASEAVASSVPSSVSEGSGLRPPDDWTLQGERIRAEKKTWPTNSVLQQYGEMQNSGDYAYMSDPINISGPGEYQLVFRVTGEFNPNAITYMDPPDATFAHSYVPTSAEVSPQGTYTVTMVVGAGQDVNYEGFAVWIY